MKLLFTIGAEHVGHSTVRLVACKCCGSSRTISLASAIGRPMAIDIGKRVYDNDGVIQVENNAQRDARLQRGVVNPEVQA